MTRKNLKPVEFIKKHIENFKPTPTICFVVVAATAGLGYFAGVNHYKIEAVVGPVFGYNAHSSELDLSSVQETYSALAAYYDGDLDTQALIDGANSGLVAAAGDDYTVYMNAEEADDYGDSLSGNIGGGIGAEIGLRNERVTIVRVLADNPAVEAGLRADDIITAINGDSTEGYTVNDAVMLIRGEEGTTVKLTIERDGETKDYTITRAIINNPSVTGENSNGIGIITITRFDSETGDLARTAAEDLIIGGVESIILDLRDNGGGYVDAARDVAGLWLNNKTVVVEKSNGIIRETVKTRSDAILAGYPTAVLVNGSSASASEIVAGALQDYEAAELVGATTFGKGTVQQLVDLSDGAQLKVTIARWYTPNGVNITEEGIDPDYDVELTRDDLDEGLDPQMDKAKSILE